MKNTAADPIAEALAKLDARLTALGMGGMRSRSTSGRGIDATTTPRSG